MIEKRVEKRFGVQKLLQQQTQDLKKEQKKKVWRQGLPGLSEKTNR